MAPMPRTVGKLEAQLARWSARIDRLAAAIEKAGAGATIGEHQRIDELRVWRAIAQTRFEEYRASGEEEREGFRSRFDQAWSDLAAAMRKVRG